MNEYLFLYREKDSNDRDCCVYIEANPLQWTCNHYFSGIILHSACFSNSIFYGYEYIETILTENEYNELIQYSKAIEDLGYGIKKGDKRYNKGIELSKNIQHIFDKLKSDEAIEFQNKIIESEIEYMQSEYSLSSEDIKLIFDNYYLDFKDRGIIGSIADSVSDLGYKTACSLGYIKNGDYILEKYFDYEKLGEDLLDKEQYVELNDGRVVCLNY